MYFISKGFENILRRYNKIILGIVLLKMGRTVDALKRFEYIEEEL